MVGVAIGGPFDGEELTYTGVCSYCEAPSTVLAIQDDKDRFIGAYRLNEEGQFIWEPSP